MRPFQKYQYDSAQLEKIRYSLSVILFELEKIIPLAISAWLLGCFDYFVITFFVISSLRMFMGGFHRKTSIGCIIQSFITFGALIYLEKTIKVTKIVYLIIIVFTALVIMFYAPVISSSRGKASERKKKKIKRNAFIALIFVSMVSIVLKNKYVAIYIPMFAQAMETYLAKLRETKKGRYKAIKSY